jgi:hypothetical protein
MAFNWNFRPTRIPGMLQGPDVNEELARQAAIQQAAENMQGYRPSVNLNSQFAMQGYTPADNSFKGSLAQPDLNGYGESLQAASDAAAQAQAKEQKIADIQNQIATLKKRITENEAKLKYFAGNVDQIAAIEARKINTADPTSIWRWKVDHDEARRIAKEQNKSKDIAKTNAMIEIANDLDSIIVDDKMTSQDQKAYLSKLSNMKTLGEKAGVPKSVIDNINAKIAEVKGETKSENKKAPEGSEYEGTSRDQWDNEAKELLSKPNLTQGDITKFKQKNPNISNEVRQELEKKHSELIESDKKKTYEKKWNSYLADYEKQNGKVSDKFKATLRRLYDKKNKKD